MAFLPTSTTRQKAFPKSGNTAGAFILGLNSVAVVGEKKCGLFVRNICLSGRGCACSRCYSTSKSAFSREKVRNEQVFTYICNLKALICTARKR